MQRTQDILRYRGIQPFEAPSIIITKHVPYARIAATARAIGNTRALNERRLLMRAVVEELVVFHAFGSNQHDALCVPYVWHACESSRGIRRDVRADRGNQVRVFGDA